MENKFSDLQRIGQVKGYSSVITVSSYLVANVTASFKTDNKKAGGKCWGAFIAGIPQCSFHLHV